MHTLKMGECSTDKNEKNMKYEVIKKNNEKNIYRENKNNEDDHSLLLLTLDMYYH